MIFMISFGLIFMLLVISRVAVKFRQSQNMIEGASYEVDRARQERRTIRGQQFTIYSDGDSRDGYDQHGAFNW